VELSVRSAFESYTIDDAVDEFARASEWPERLEALSVLAAAAPQDFDQRVFEAMSAGLTDEHPLVRHKAVLAVFYARWREFLPLLQKLAADDSQEVRRVAAIAVEVIDDPELDPYPS
jgi:HEAT repeat protein